jgi:hypothetical protein
MPRNYTHSDFFAKWEEKLSKKPLSASFQQGDKTSLLKMFIASQSLCNLVLFHDNERDAVRKCPPLIEVLIVKSKRAVE